MREARVRQSSSLGTVQAHTGREYIRTEWRAVPDDGSVCQFLEYREPGVEAELEPDAIQASEPAAPVSKPAPRRRTKAVK